MGINTDPRRGAALMAAIIIILIVAIVVLGIISFASNASYLNTGRSLSDAALAAAQAGVYAAIIDYEADSRWNGASNVALITGKLFYSCGKSANYLLLDASRPQFAAGGGTNRQLQRIGHTNINSASPITVDQVKVEWQGFAGSLTQVYLGGALRWNGTASSGTTVTLTSNFTLNASQSFTGAAQNYLQFSITIPVNAVIFVTYHFTDGSSRKAMVYNAGRGGNSEFSIISTGRQSAGTDNWKRSIEATYDTVRNKITSWRESTSHI